MTTTSTPLRVSRRTILSAGTGLVAYAVSVRAAKTTKLRAPIAALVSAYHLADVQTLIASDRGNARWRRTSGRPHEAQSLSFRSADRFTLEGTLDPERGGWWMIDEPVLRSVHGGAVEGRANDSSSAIQAVLDAAASLKRTVDDAGTEFRVDRAITLPAGVTWSGAKLRAGTRGMNVVLISSGARFVNFEIDGSGTVSRRDSPGPSEVNERGVYPSHDGLRDAVIQGKIRNITLGVHLQPLSAGGAPPTRCQIDVEVSDIVGQVGTSEGYGVLLSPAEHCNVKVKASNVQRHAVYLSAGASYNKVDATVAGCLQDAVTIFSMAAQPPCIGNTLKVLADGVSSPQTEPVRSNSTCFSVYGKVRDTIANVSGSGARGAERGPYAAALVRGMEGADGPFPENTQLVVNATGKFSGPYVVVSTDAITTTIEGGTITAHGSVGVIGFADTRSNTRHFDLAGEVRAVSIDALDSSVPGIVIATERSPVRVGRDVRFARVSAPTRDYTGRLSRLGRRCSA